MPVFDIAPQLGRATPQPTQAQHDFTGLTAGIDAIGQLAQVGADVAQSVKRNRDQMNLARATADAAMAIDEMEFQFINEDKDYATQTDRWIEQSEKIGKEYEQRFKDNPEGLERFQFEFKNHAFKRGMSVKSNALKRDMEEQRDTLTSTLKDISSIALRGDEDHFNESVTKAEDLIAQSFDAGVLTESESIEALRSFNNELSRGKARIDIELDPNEALKNIRSNKYEGLSAEEQSRFEVSAINEIEQRKARAKHQSQKQNRETVSDAILAYQNGYQISPEEEQLALQAAQATGRTEDLQVAQAASKFILLPKASREELMKSGSLHGLRNVELRQALEAAEEIIDREIKKDAYAFAVKQGVVEEVLLDVTNPETIQARLEQVEYLKSHYGTQNISPLTDFETDQLVTALDAMAPQDKTTLALAFGPESAMWEQLDKKNANMFAMVGAIGDKEIMNAVFKGEQMLADGAVQSISKNDYISKFDEYVGGVYAGSDRTAVLKASLAHYLSTRSDGNWGADEFEKSLNAVTGGITKINGSKIELPRGVDEDDFEDYVDNFSTFSVAHFGEVFSMPNEEAAEFIRSAEWTSLGNNRYIVSKDGAALHRQDGTLYEISFDAERLEADRPVSSNARRGQR